MKPIFWSYSDDCILEYVKLNKSHQDIAHKFPYYLAHSGTMPDDVWALYGPTARLLPVKDNRALAKVHTVLEAVRG